MRLHRCLIVTVLFASVFSLQLGCSSQPKVTSGLTTEYDKIVVAQADTPKEEESIRPDPVTYLRMGNGVTTAIQNYSVKPALQQSLIEGLRREARRVDGTVSGLISINLHKSQDGKSVISYLQFENRASYEKWRKGSDMNEKSNGLRNQFQNVNTQIYDLVFVQQ